ncbi:MAG: hypothetical protein ABJM36_15470 [Algibacter sp.]|uniref:tetratricopeptide repeat protein n=1 Tax=Algibacter sp. TaxID=1872428 RepID=UPI00329929F5
MKDNSTISQELLEIIERYINGSLSTQELKDFNQLIELDPEFKQQVEDFKTVLKGDKNQSLKKQIEGINGEPLNPTVKKQPKPKVRFLIVKIITAVVATIIAVGGIWFFSTPENEKLYVTHFKPDPGLPTTASNSKNLKFYDGMTNYNNGEYDLAIKKWSTLQQRNPENDTLNYYIGVAYLANKKIIEAIPYLEHSVEADDNFIFLDDAYLYLGLAYLKESNLDLAKKNLTISNTEPAKTILLKLKR